MAANQQLQFLQEKIQEINTAILFNLSDSVLKFPTTIVSTLKVDDYGYVWFFVKKPKQDIREFETEFPVRLDYFKKGKECFLQVMGKAWVVTDPEELNAFVLQEDMHQEISDDMVLVKVKMMKADYQETSSRSSNSWWGHAFSSIFTWFRSSNTYRPNTYFPAS